MVGKALKPVWKKVVLASGSRERTKQALLDDIDLQRKAYGTEVIDLFYLLAVGKPEAISDELMEALAEAKRAGKIRACAISTHNYYEILPRILELGKSINAVMVTCNFAAWDSGSWEDAVKSITQLRSAGIGIVAMKSLMGGMGSAPKGRTDWYNQLNTPARKQAALAAALRWVLDHPQVDTVPVAIKNEEQLTQIIQAASQSFTENDKEILTASLSEMGDSYCRMCQQCAGTCRHGLPVSDLLRYLMYAEGYGNLDVAQQHFRDLPEHIQSVRCTQCDQCSVDCPNGVRIKERVALGQEMLSPA